MNGEPLGLRLPIVAIVFFEEARWTGVEGSMLHSKTSKFVILAAVCLLWIGSTGSAHAQAIFDYATEWSGGKIINLGALPGTMGSAARAINNSGVAVGYSISGNYTVYGDNPYATEWKGGKIINLGGLPGSTGSDALAINNSGAAVGYSISGDNTYATEWSDGKIINLGGLPGSVDSGAADINNRGQVVGYSIVGGATYATEWSDGNVINLGSNAASSINDAGVVVGNGPDGAIEWSGGSIINLAEFPGAIVTSALSINDAGVAVGYSVLPHAIYATEWSDGKIINLGELPGSDDTSFAFSINDRSQVVGNSEAVATEWSDGNVINLGGLMGSAGSYAYSINDRGQVVGFSGVVPPPPPGVPEPSTWAMMLVGFAGLGYAGYRRARAGSATLAAAPGFNLSILNSPFLMQFGNLPNDFKVDVGH